MAATIQSIQAKLRRAAEEAEMTQQQIGEAMGFSSSGARQAVSRLLSQPDYDPRLSTLIEFAKAVKKPLAEIL